MTGKSNRQGSHKHSYVPTLKSGNPEKKPRMIGGMKYAKLTGK